jgi:hypothetical protein
VLAKKAEHSFMRWGVIDFEKRVISGWKEIFWRVQFRV